MKSPIPWFGGKYYLVNKFKKYIPKHTYYAEVFGGGGSLLFAKEPSDFEVYNDIDSRLVTFFRVLRDRYNELERLVTLTPYSREIFYDFREKLQNEDDELLIAYYFYIIARMSFSGSFGKSWSFTAKTIRRKMVANVSKYLSSIEMLPEISARLKTVLIENVTFDKMFINYISKWEYNNSFVYLDPPYVHSTRKSGKYDYEMTDEDHIRLLTYITNDYFDRAKYMISGYENEIYANYLRKWRKVCFSTAAFAENKLNKTKRLDCIWMNY